MNSRKELLKRSEKLFNSIERRNAEARWESICKFVVPNQLVNFSAVEHTTPGNKRTTGVYTSEAMVACRDLAAFIRDFADPTEKPTFRFVEEALNNKGEATRWLEQCTYLLHHHLTESNLDAEASKNYAMFPALGNMALLQEVKKPKRNGVFGGFVFKSLHLAEVAWAENSDGVVDTIFRKLKLTAKQAIEMFGYDNVSDKIKGDIDAYKVDEVHDFIHCIVPRLAPYNKSKSPTGIITATDMPFESVYIEVSSGESVKEDGYFEFPAFITRWDTSPGEVTGRGPGHLAEPEIKTLNKFVELSLKAFHRSVNAPLLVSRKNALSRLEIGDNMQSVVSDIDGVRYLTNPTNFSQIDYAHKRFSDVIQKIFYLDKLYLPPRSEVGEMSAYEVSRRMEQAHKVLGPTAGRLNHEFLSPMLLRSFSVLLREGAFPPVPEILKVAGIDIKVDFVSQMVRSQKLRDGTTVQGWVSSLGQMALALGPNILDNVNSDQAALILGRALGVPESTIRTDEEVGAIRKQKEDAAKQQMQIDASVKAADVASKTKHLQ